MKKSTKKLALNKQVVRNLTEHDSAQVVGGRGGGGTWGTTDANPQCSGNGSTCGPGNSGNPDC